MTNMATTPIYSKNLFNFFPSRTNWQIALKVGKKHRVHKYYEDCLNVDLGLTLTFLMARSNMRYGAWKMLDHKISWILLKIWAIN